jgi:S-DNA-T family DNA segregation ATPase FtsK/SpoIIIE
MIKRPDAASLKEAGRFYLQVGHDEYFDIGQAGWAGAKYVPTDKVIRKRDDSIHFINNTGYTFKTINDPVIKEKSDDKADQLTSVVKYIIDVADRIGYESKQLWRSIIPSEIFVHNLKEKYKPNRKAFHINPLIGEYDNPAAQFQGLLTLDISGKGNALIYGKQGSGKENLLSTIIYSTAIEHHPKEVNFYVIDMGTEALRMFDRLPHVADMCFIDDGEKIQDLLNMLHKEMTRRKQLFVEYNGSYMTYCQRSGKTEPTIIVAINNYEIFIELYEKYAELLPTMYRDGNKVGVYFILTTSATGAVKTRVAELFGNKICLQMPNDTDYRDFLGAPRKLVPLSIFGRGVVALNHGQFEFQTAYIHNPAEISNVVNKMAELFKQYDYVARRIPVLPERVTLSPLISYMRGLESVPVGINIETKEIYTHNFAKNRVNVIATADMEDQADFIHALIAQFNANEEISIRVIDGLGILNPNLVGPEYYASDFEIILPGICYEMSQEAHHETYHVYIITGLSDLLNRIDPSVKQEFNETMSQAANLENSYFILADNMDAIKALQSEAWYTRVVDRKAGLWMGYGVGEQAVVAIQVTMDDRKLKDLNLGYVTFKNHRIVFKKVVFEEGESIHG